MMLYLYYGFVYKHQTQVGCPFGMISPNTIEFINQKKVTRRLQTGLLAEISVFFLMLKAEAIKKKYRW